MARATVRRATRWRSQADRVLEAAQGALFAGTSWRLDGHEETAQETTLTARADLHDARLVVRITSGQGDTLAVELELSADLPWLDEASARAALHAWLSGFDVRARRLRER